MKAILIDEARTLSVVETPGTLEDLQRFVGGYIEAAFTLPSPEGGMRNITGYVDEEGLINGKPYSFIGVQYGDFVNVVNGPMIVIGLDDTEGETVGLTDREVAAIHLSPLRVLSAPHIGRQFVPVVTVDPAPAFSSGAESER